MNARRYRFSKSLGSAHETVPDEWCATLDAAIERAKDLSKAMGIAIHVVDCGSTPFRPRGVANGKRWSWLKDCRYCGGTGKFTLRATHVPGGRPPPPQTQQCEKCFGHGVVVDQSA